MDLTPPAGQGHIRLTVQSTLIGRARFGVRARVDGEPVTVTQHGETLIPVAAGRHDVECFMVFAGEYGHASVAVDVPPGGQVAAYYAPPFQLGIPGRLGTEPQQAAGAWWVYLVGAVLVLGIVYAMVR